MSRGQELTPLLRGAGQQNPSALAAVFSLVYDNLKSLAVARTMDESPDSTLCPTALVHECFLRLAKNRDLSCGNRAQFYAAAALAMRRILVDRARRVKSLKRGGDHTRRALESFELDVEHDPESILDLSDALDALGDIDERKRQVVLLRFFAGRSVAECAELLEISETTVKEEWRFARAWLLARIAGSQR